jgi:hypothetical protein
MAIVRNLPAVEAWLDADADSRSALTDREYKAIVSGWTQHFSRLVAEGAPSLQGDRAILSVEKRLPADLFLFAGLRVPRLANMGGVGPAGYRANGLRCVRRDTANQMELIIVSIDLAWSCVFSHEAGVFVQEHLYDRAPCA